MNESMLSLLIGIMTCFLEGPLCYELKSLGLDKRTTLVYE